MISAAQARLAARTEKRCLRAARAVVQALPPELAGAVERAAGAAFLAFQGQAFRAVFPSARGWRRWL